MPKNLAISEKLFEKLRAEYLRQWGITLTCTSPAGDMVCGKVPCSREGESFACRSLRAQAIEETLRWGEPTVVYCEDRHLLWAMPIMHNEVVIGGLLACTTERKVLTIRKDGSLFNLRGACESLRIMCERENLTNASALAIAREKYQAEQRRAYAIHDYKNVSHSNLRELYLREEPELFSAIRCGDRRSAQEILNRVLVGIYFHADNRFEVVKSFVLELIVSMCRTAVDAGGEPEELLGANFAVMTALAKIKDEEELTAWLTQTFERLFSSIQKSRASDSNSVLMDAVAFMERHCGENVSRNDAARAAHLSPQYFSSLLHQKYGLTFTELIGRMRIDRAAEMLANTNNPLSVIAIDCGFQDQSYFTKVFKKYRKTTPLEYRKTAIK
ncbi:MAG TPA: AraC family transcriptional regulator [Phycisphaerae bacterium]|nr:AraC family transcriptional regulator [Phycisphaerae bacterium]HPS53258.1 AraC family transcriptional regulator [Phycisphaerae bacterium]